MIQMINISTLVLTGLIALWLSDKVGGRLKGKTKIGIVIGVVVLVVGGALGYKFWGPVHNTTMGVVSWASTAHGSGGAFLIALLIALPMGVLRMMFKEYAPSDFHTAIDAVLLFGWGYLALHLLGVGTQQDQTVIATVAAGLLVARSLVKKLWANKWGRFPVVIVVGMLVFPMIVGYVNPRLRVALDRGITAGTDEAANDLNDYSNGVAIETLEVYGVAKIPVQDLYVAIFTPAGQISTLAIPTTSQDLEKGDVVLVINPDDEYKMYGGQAYVEVRLPNASKRFEPRGQGISDFWVEAGFLEFQRGKTEKVLSLWRPKLGQSKDFKFAAKDKGRQKNVKFEYPRGLEIVVSDGPVKVLLGNGISAELRPGNHPYKVAAGEYVHFVSLGRSTVRFIEQ